MRKLHVKVCGMRDPINIKLLADAGPDYLGFIFYRASPRYVGEDFAIPSGLNQPPLRVGVFVNEEADRVIELAGRFALSLIQLHGDETPDTCRQLVDAGLKVMKVIRVAQGEDVKRASEFPGAVSYFMFETMSAQYGGSGRSFDWNLLNQYEHDIPYFLSGGLSATNLDRALDLAGRDSRLHALDFNSGIELSPGLKDVEKFQEIKKIISQHEIQR
ncbi:MAG: phosphoribosylanthranilate isomerase [Cyclobacteriaceae bacterium]